MATRQINHVVEHIRKVILAGDAVEVSDGHLVECFIARREETAFELLVRRHGPMVLSVCRRVLANHHDAEDAFQATFLVLARKANSIVPRQMVGNWLYGVAYQTALKARSASTKRHIREKQMNRMPEPVAATQASWSDLQVVLDQELSRLGDKYRVPIVLCDLEGKSQKTAAQQLGIPEGTFSSRLSRARTMLARRLARHGVTFSAGALAVSLAQHGASACVPPVLANITIKAAGAYAAGETATRLVSGSVASLIDGVLRAMLLTKLKTIATVMVVLGMCAFGGRLLTNHMATGQEVTADRRDDEPPAPSVIPFKHEAAKKSKGGKEVKSNLRVVAEPFQFKGSYYLKLSVHNPEDKPALMNGIGDPSRTTAKLFTVLADGKESTYRPFGAYMVGGFSFDKRELAPKSQLFSGIVLLAGKDKGRLCDGYTTRFDLATGQHEIEVFANNMTSGFAAAPAKLDKNITPATLKVTIPAKLESADDQNVPKSAKPLRFTLTAHYPDAKMVHVTIYTTNESTDLWHFPYRGETTPAHRSNWYQLEVDGKIVKPTWNEYEHKDIAGKRELPPMQRRFAHTFKIVSEKSKDRKFGKNDYFPLYVLPEGEHMLRVIPSPLWTEQKTPVPAPASIRIQIPEPKKPVEP